MAENPVRFGIIGCADIAKKVDRSTDLAPNAVFHAISSRSIEKARNFAVTNGLPEAVNIYESYDQVLDDPCVDAVYVPLPTSLHVHWVVLAERKKNHLLLKKKKKKKKSTAFDVAKLDRILQACQSNVVQFMDGSMWLHELSEPEDEEEEVRDDDGGIREVDNQDRTSARSLPSTLPAALEPRSHVPVLVFVG
ncbi:uncharacterized oxidoreductase At4g09670-like [Carya illinoinensis]|uniref:Gfo/Idh/MocA-like oxidoreductase N-terminal domain-containing protein n=1 Tax=Carya illinoinensis TaxID=32201 RepID=A0A8T1Q1Z1_CARIL|nr:uncharacterized oxidoreductase At4g09670-like [Carya illinoinensis]KAG6647887.1 hypothetical protein CIPAW_07G109400 [Carya illinoinensis]